MKKLFLVISTIISFNAFSSDGPFGTTWGQSVGELEKAGMVCSEKETDSDNDLVTCKTTSLFKDISIKDFYFLLFSKQYGLQKVVMFSSDVTGDITGREGKELYNKYKSVLTKKYSDPSFEWESVGRKLYKEYDEFYQCLAYDGCGNYVSHFKPKDGGLVAIELKGLSRGKGFMKLTYEGSKWIKHLDEVKNRKKEVDSDAL